MLVIKVNKNSDTDFTGKHLFRKIHLRVFPMLLGIIMIMIVPFPAFGKTVVEWDFSKGTYGWTGNDRVANLFASSEGLIVKSIGQDPWIEGPAVNFPSDKVVRVKIRMKSNAGVSAELFYGKSFTPERSVQFIVHNDGQWHDYHFVLQNKLGPETRLRLDPCPDKGEVTVAFIRAEAMGKIPPPPSLEKPQRPHKNNKMPVSIKSGMLKFEHYAGTWGDFILKVDDIEMAAGYNCELIGFLFDDSSEWLNLKNAKVAFVNLPKHKGFRSKAIIEDSKGGKWEIQRHIRPAKLEGTLIIETELKVNQDRDIIRIPWLTIFPSLGTFGEKKYQGLFAGVEYLSDEPSSSDADIGKPNHIRRVPDPLKITFPLMAIEYDDNYIGVIWEPSDMVAATFDSPDRIYNSGAHIMSLSAPAVGELRLENSFSAYAPFKLEANKPLKVSALIIGGKGKTIIPAVKHYIDLKGFPSIPQFEGDFNAAVNLLAHGWLDSQINNNGLFRHAVWLDNFPPGPAAEAAMFIAWLANHTEDKKLYERLNEAKYEALGKIPSGEPFSSYISHIHQPTTPFIFGKVNEFVQLRHNQALDLLRSFDENGVKLYKPGKTDYSRTHFAKHANGYAAPDIVRILESAALSGDKKLIGRALKLLDKQTILYANTVPRGAQTWEMPLHTPDIVASAYMIKAYVLGYIISGKEDYLEQARYWAWTGVPFLYLYPPTVGKTGLYATIAVLGATNWKAPVWFGRPVQWCGLVYCSALHFLSEYDTKGPWGKIAKGITITGLQMSWPLTDKEQQGLLPDYFFLKEQISEGPAINPGTVQAHLPELYGKGKIYDLKKLPNNGWFIHAPCAINNIQESEDEVTLVADGWADEPYYMLISGLETEPAEVSARKLVGSKSLPFKPAQNNFYREYKYLTIKLKGKSEIQIR